MLFNFILPIDRTLSGATSLGQNGPGSDGNKWVLRITQRSTVAEAIPSVCSVPWTGHSLEKSYSSAELQSVYSAAPADKAKIRR